VVFQLLIGILHCIVSQSRPSLHLCLREILFEHLSKLVLVLVELRGSTDLFVLFPGPLQTSLRPPGNFLRLVLGEVAHHRKEDVAHQFVFGVEVRLGVGPEANAEGFELLKIRDRLSDTFPRKAIQTPEDEDIELAIFSRLEHLIEGLPLPPPLSAGLVVDVLTGELVAFLLETFPQLPALIFFGLLAAHLRDAKVEDRSFRGVTARFEVNLRKTGRHGRRLRLRRRDRHASWYSTTVWVSNNDRFLTPQKSSS
jgi:hypothetical protein